MLQGDSTATMLQEHRSYNNGALNMVPGPTRASAKLDTCQKHKSHSSGLNFLVSKTVKNPPAEGAGDAGEWVQSLG